jgi:hypothetical protein
VAGVPAGGLTFTIRGAQEPSGKATIMRRMTTSAERVLNFITL